MKRGEQAHIILTLKVPHMIFNMKNEDMGNMHLHSLESLVQIEDFMRESLVVFSVPIV